jgi:hypothetical protein
MRLDHLRTLAVIHSNIPFSQQNPFNPFLHKTSLQKSQPWRDTVRKKLGTTVLLITLACGVASADTYTPSKRCAKSFETTWMQKIDNAFRYFKAWF